MVITVDDLSRRNAVFAAGGTYSDLSFPTIDTLRVVGCVDSRVDPSDVLGLDLGEAVVMRNIGGRITPAALRSWQLLRQLVTARPGAPPPSARPRMVIMHHVDCGIKALAAVAPEELAEFFEIPVEELETKAINDPYESVRIDVELARRALPPALLISGLVYDPHTGLVEVVVPAE